MAFHQLLELLEEELDELDVELELELDELVVPHELLELHVATVPADTFSEEQTHIPHTGSQSLRVYPLHCDTKLL